MLNLATSARAPLLTRLPPFSPVAVKLLGLVSDSDASLKDIAKMLSLDPSLSGQVLRAANSGLYGRRVAVQSILHAVAMLGLSKVSQIAITAAISHGLPRRSSPWMRNWWRHSIAAALVAEDAGKDRLEVNYGYTAGLLHAIGQLALFQQTPNEYARMAAAGYTDGRDLMEWEQARFGADHAELAGLLLAEWGLPAVVHKAVAEHHGTGASDPLVAAVQIGCRAAEWRGFGQCGCAKALPAGRNASWPPAVDTFLQSLPIEINRVECSLL